MFRKYLMGWFFGWLLLALGCAGLIYFSSTNSKIAYQQLMNEDQANAENLIAKGPAHQERRQVNKQILYQKGSQRMQMRLMSETSDLTYSKKDGKFVESFKDLICMMQEPLIQSSNEELSVSPSTNSSETSHQIIRQFKAREALYSYKSGQLEAKEVEMAHFLFPGMLWPASLDQTSPLFQGKADAVNLSLFKEPNLNAKNFQATFHHWENE